MSSSFPFGGKRKKTIGGKQISHYMYNLQFQYTGVKVLSPKPPVVRIVFLYCLQLYKKSNTLYKHARANSPTIFMPYLPTVTISLFFH
jgi:hypothetical protein